MQKAFPHQPTPAVRPARHRHPCHSPPTKLTLQQPQPVLKDEVHSPEGRLPADLRLRIQNSVVVPPQQILRGEVR